MKPYFNPVKVIKTNEWINEIKFIGLKERGIKKKNIFGKEQSYVFSERKLKRSMKDTLN